MIRRRSAPALAALVGAVVLSASACDRTPPAPAPSPSGEPTRLSFGVYGPPEEIDAYRALVQAYNEEAQAVEVSINSWPSREAMLAAMAQGQRRPDVFLTSRSDLLALTETDANQPVLELLDERGVDFGDGYSRSGLMAFSEDGELQCMPYGISPQVVYYNTELIDFDRMAALGLDVPTPDEPLEIGEDVDDIASEDAEDGSTESPTPGPSPDPDDSPSVRPSDPGAGPTTSGPTSGGTYRRWTFDQFVAAAEFASRPRQGSKGVYVEPSLAGLEPFVYAAGGRVYDDNDAPTSLAFADDSTRDALAQILPLLRDPQLTPTEKDLDGSTALEMFKQGKLGMLPGFRDLTPELRATPGLDFDVLPIPSIEGSATVGDIDGLCISAEARSIARAADFLVYVVSSEAVTRVTESGYLVPANLKVLQSEDFLNPRQMPDNSRIFSSALRDVRLAPLLDRGDDLAAAVDPSIEQLLTVPVLGDLEPLTLQIDEESRAVLADETTPQD